MKFNVNTPFVCSLRSWVCINTSDLNSNTLIVLSHPATTIEQSLLVAIAQQNCCYLIEFGSN